ncbi:POM121-like protein 12 [Tamandua tetradactyla]|uniref:POM121-like protein 12 n=1 Tax=Tamandua tetradactyla TaxID=48850 RepID=UPI004053C31E
MSCRCAPRCPGVREALTDSKLLEAESRLRDSPRPAAVMDSYLSSYLGASQPSLQPPAPKRPSPPPRPARSQPGPAQRPVLRAPGERCVDTRPLPQIPPELEPVNLRRVLVTEAWRRFPNKLTPQTIWWPDPSCAKDIYWKRWLWNARNRRRFRSPVTVKIAPPGSRGSGFNICPPRDKSPESCARETVVKALSQCKKARMKFDETLWFENPEKKRRKSSLGARRSAFKLVVRNGVSPTFLPRPGLLKRRLRFKRETVWWEKADPRPNIQPFRPAAQPTAGTAPAWGTGPPLERWAKMQHSWILGPSYSAWEQHQ